MVFRKQRLVILKVIVSLPLATGRKFDNLIGLTYYALSLIGLEKNSENIRAWSVHREPTQTACLFVCSKYKEMYGKY